MCLSVCFANYFLMKQSEQLGGNNQTSIKFNVKWKLFWHIKASVLPPACPQWLVFVFGTWAWNLKFSYFYVYEYVGLSSNLSPVYPSIYIYVPINSSSIYISLCILLYVCVSSYLSIHFSSISLSLTLIFKALEWAALGKCRCYLCHFLVFSVNTLISLSAT